MIVLASLSKRDTNVWVAYVPQHICLTNKAVATAVLDVLSHEIKIYLSSRLHVVVDIIMPFVATRGHEMIDTVKQKLTQSRFFEQNKIEAWLCSPLQRTVHTCRS